MESLEDVKNVITALVSKAAKRQDPTAEAVIAQRDWQSRAMPGAVKIIQARLEGNGRTAADLQEAEVVRVVFEELTKALKNGKGRSPFGR